MQGFATAARLAGLVTSMAFLTVGGGLLGRHLDARFDTAPGLLFVGLLGGFAAGMVALFREISRLGTDDDRRPPDP
ncbi:MAG: AtpZ/AtpI family protein [Myxococcota bacterium]